MMTRGLRINQVLHFVPSFQWKLLCDCIMSRYYIILTSIILMKRGKTGCLLTAISGTLGNTSGTIIGVRAVIWGPVFDSPPSPPDSSPPDSELSPPFSPEKPALPARFPNILSWIMKGREVGERSSGWPRRTPPTRTQRKDLAVKLQPADIVVPAWML